MRTITGIAVVLAAASGAACAAAAATAPPGHDEAMLALATHSGCLTCHSVKPALDGEAKPIGPAWQDVAAKYRDQKDAVSVLTNTVMGGSNPYASHWKGKVSGLAMPPNGVAISRADARELVRWILSLHPRGA